MYFDYYIIFTRVKFGYYTVSGYPGKIEIATQTLKHCKFKGQDRKEPRTISYLFDFDYFYFFFNLIKKQFHLSKQSINKIIKMNNDQHDYNIYFANFNQRNGKHVCGATILKSMIYFASLSSKYYVFFTPDSKELACYYNLQATHIPSPLLFLVKLIVTMVMVTEDQILQFITKKRPTQLKKRAD